MSLSRNNGGRAVRIDRNIPLKPNAFHDALTSELRRSKVVFCTEQHLFQKADLSAHSSSAQGFQTRLPKRVDAFDQDP